MLHELLSNNRSELITRCRAKAARRFAPAEVPEEADQGVPLFLGQLVDTLRLEQHTTVRAESEPLPTPAPTQIGRSAALHGTQMLQRGYSVDQVVHSYGDVCQSITELAVERNSEVSADEFRTLNRCLDDAIADAVTAFAQGHQSTVTEQATTLGERLDAFSSHHEHLLDMAIKSYTAIQTGIIGPSGATGNTHKNLLLALRSLTRQFMNQVRTAPAQTTPPLFPNEPAPK